MRKKAINKKELENMYINLNMTDNEIAKVKGITQSHVGYLRRQYGIDAKRNGKEIALDRITFEKLYLDHGLSEKDIAVKYGLSKGYISQLRRKYGIKSKNGKSKSISKEELKKLYIDLGMSDRQISGAKGLSKSTVTKLRKLYGIEPKYESKIKKPYLTDEIKRYFNELLIKNNINFKEEDKINYHYVINNKKVRIIHSKDFIRSKFNFKFTYPKYQNFENSDSRIKVGDKKYKLIFKTLCDYIVLIGLIYEDPLELWVFSSQEIDEHLEIHNHISLGRYGKKFNFQYMNLDRLKE